MRTVSRLKILNKNITLITNSSLLKKYIEKGFALSLSKYKNQTSSRLSFSLKNPQDIQEILPSVLKLTGSILEKDQDKYWIFHGTAFSNNGKATVVLGDAGTGKSSLCFAAGLCGAKIISDEPVLIDKKTYSVIPFRYLIKIDRFYDSFSKCNFYSWLDLSRNRFTRKGGLKKIDFTIFTKEDLNKLNIKVEDRKISLKNIIFLEVKRYDSVIHLSKHCLNKGQNLLDCLKSLNNFIHCKKVKFLPDIIHTLKDGSKAKEVFNKIIST